MEVSLGAAAFWLALAAVIIAGGWFKSRSEAMKHETLRQLAQRTGQVDEAQLRLLLTPPAPPAIRCQPPPRPGSNYRGLRVGGVVVMSLGLGGMLAFSLVRFIVGAPDALIGVALSSGVVVLGAGLFVSSRFDKPPPAAAGNSLEDRAGEAPGAEPADAPLSTVSGSPRYPSGDRPAS